MRVDEATEIARSVLPEKRFAHVLGVIETAQNLASRYGADVEKAGVAAAFHDIAKFDSEESMRLILLEHGNPQEVLDYDLQLWHSPVGAIYAQQKYGINDEEILDAIRFHTTGRANMSLLEKIIFIADYIEPGRKTPGVEQCRLKANENLDKAVIHACEATVQFLQAKGMGIHPDTINTYNYYMGE